MTDYQILTDVQTPIPPRNIKARTVAVLLDTADKDTAASILRSAARALLDGDALTIYAYIEREAVKWQGWIGRVEYFAGGVPRVFFDNDPYLREAIYRDLTD